MIVPDLEISEDNFIVIQPMLIILRLFGLFPISYTKRRGQYVLKWSVIYAIYSYFLNLSIIAVSLDGLIKLVKIDAPSDSNVESKKSSFVTYCGFIGGTSIVIFGIATLNNKLRKLWNVMHILNQADKIMSIKNPQQCRKSSIYFLFTVLTTLTLIVTFNNSSLFDKFETRYLVNVDLQTILSFAALYLTLYIIVVKSAFYWHIIYFIKIRISLLNESLSQLKVQDSVSDGTVIRRLTGQNRDLAFPSRIDAQRQNTPTNTFQTSDIVNTVASLTEYQDRIFQAVDSINSTTAYGVHLLMLSNLLQLVISLYNLLEEAMSDSNPVFIIIQVVWILSNIGRILIVVEPCELCMNNHKKTLNLVCRLLICDFDEDVKNALIILSDHISSYEFDFTAAGLFTINRSLITSLGGAVTTYIIIVYQFNVE